MRKVVQSSKPFFALLFSVVIAMMAISQPIAYATEESNESKHYLGTVVNAGHDTGFSENNAISENDPHFGWKLGEFYVNGYTRVTEDKNGTPVFLKTVGDTVTLWFKLEQDITKLNGDETLSINDDANGHDEYFGIEKTDMGRGTLIIRHTDYQNHASDPVIYTDYLAATASQNAAVEVKLCEEGDYEVALDYELRKNNLDLSGWNPFPSYNDYRIFFRFSVRNGNCMVYPFDVVTGAELTNSSITENGFYLDLAKSRGSKELVRGSVEETLNELLEKEAESLTQAARYERSEARQGYRSGHYDRNLTTTSGDVTLHMPRLKGVSFETAIIERYRRRESSVEEALIEMYLAGVSVRRVEDITEALWGSKVSPATISELNKKAYVHIEDWRNRPLRGGRYPYVYVDGIYLRRNWGGEYENVAVLVAIAVNEDGFREVLGAAEGMKEDKASWVSFFQWLRGRGLDGVKLIVGDKCMGMLEAVGEVFPDAKYQRCTVHFYRNVFSVVPKSKVKIVAKMLKAIHAQESKKASREKAKAVVEELRSMKLKEAAKKVEDGIEETLTYCDFPSEHWTRIRTNNVIERLNREIRRRTRVVGTFPDGNSALMLACARLRHVAGTQWGNKKYMNMKHLEAALDDVSIAG